MLIYVAGGWLEKDTIVVPLLRRLRAEGIEVSYDWTGDGPSAVTVEEHIKAEASLSQDERKMFAFRDYEGVKNADLVWLVVPGYEGSTGSWTELGLALAFGKPVIVSGAGHKKNIFTTLSQQICETHEEGFQKVLRVKELIKDLQSYAF
jgi:nucleoside 2-deoxyribosyltransferase